MVVAVIAAGGIGPGEVRRARLLVEVAVEALGTPGVAGGGGGGVAAAQRVVAVDVGDYA